MRDLSYCHNKNNNLGWEHGYLSSARFANGSTWYNEPGWSIGEPLRYSNQDVDLTLTEQ